MNGRGFSNGRGHRKNQGAGSGGSCTCRQCGYSIKHEAGVPCHSIVCPNCNIVLGRNETQAGQSDSSKTVKQKNKAENSERTIQFPKVVSEKCTACGICIEKCPTNAIVIKNDKAFVENSICRTCRLCIKICPFDAFILE